MSDKTKEVEFRISATWEIEKPDAGHYAAIVTWNCKPEELIELLMCGMKRDKGFKSCMEVAVRYFEQIDRMFGGFEGFEGFGEIKT